MENEEGAIERIEAKRVVNGQVEFNVKWIGLPRHKNTWQSAESLNCPHLIAQFEGNFIEMDVTTTKATVKSSMKPKECKFKPHKILGVTTNSSGQLMFLMQWKNSDKADLVHANVANVKCPQIVIKFYEEHIEWQNIN